ncbi:MAG: hypothetical protein IK068_00350, partial [Lachnospiraceae bacterium]|nr:hypothetical protein [Lachnospiraceae bacterium]
IALEKGVINPSYIRMVCYLLKLAERYEDKADIFFVEITGKDGAQIAKAKEETAKEKLTAAISKHLERYDINIEYTKNRNLCVFFNRNLKQLAEVVDVIKSESDDEFDIQVKEITSELL